jgi:hypothetical protein
MASGRKKKSAAKMARKSKLAPAVTAMAAAGPTPQAVLDNTFALGVALQNQSLDTGRWTADQVDEWTGERRDVMLIHQQLEAPASKLHGYAAAQLQALVSSGTAATSAVQNARGPSTMESALTAARAHKVLLRAAA